MIREPVITYAAISPEDKELVLTIFRFIGYEAPPKQKNESDTPYFSRIIRSCLAYVDSDLFIERLSKFSNDPGEPQIDLLANILKNMVDGRYDLISLESIKNERLASTIRLLSREIQTKYIRIDQKDDKLTRFVNVFKNAAFERKELVDAFGDLPNEIKEYFRPIYNGGIRLRQKAFANVPALQNESRNKLENYDKLDKQLASLKLIFNDLSSFIGNLQNYELKQSLKKKIKETPEQYRSILTSIYNNVQSYSTNLTMNGRWIKEMQKAIELQKQKNSQMQMLNTNLIQQLESFRDNTSEIRRLTQQNRSLKLQVQAFERNQHGEEQENSIFSQLNKRLQEQIDQLKNDIKEIDKSRRRQQAQSQQEKDNLIIQKINLEGTIERLNLKLMDHQQTIKNLQNQVRQGKSQPRKQRSYAYLKDQNYEAVERQNNRLSEKLAVLLGQNQNLQIQLREIAQQSQRAKQNQSDQLYRRIQDLEDQLEASKRENVNINRLNTQKIEQSRCSDMQNQIRNLRSENQKLRGDKKWLEEQIRVAKDKTDKFADKVDRALLLEENRKVKQTQRSVSMLQQRNDQLLAQNRSLQQRINLNQAAKTDGQSALVSLLTNNYENAKRQILQLKTKIASFKQQLEDKDKEKLRTITLKAELESNKIRVQLQDLKEKHDKLARIYQDQTRRMNELIQITKEKL